MTMKYLALCVLLVGCGMENDEVIAQVKKCQEAGLRPTEFINPNGSTMYIQCKLPESSK